MKNNKSNQERLVYTVQQVQGLLGLSRGLVYEAIRRGDIPSIHIGRRILIPRAALERLLLNPESSDHTGCPDSSSSGGGKQ